jgi:riboflavin synthase
MQEELRMFTGLVEVLGQVEQVVKENSGQRFALVWPDLDRPLVVGDSIAVNGCCLTVVNSAGEHFEVQAGPETLERTNLGERKAGDRVNFERSLQVSGRLGGHFVLGHIDTTAVLHERRREGEWEFLTFTLGSDWTRLMVSKGSVALDGVSLTLINVGQQSFSVMLIPHTLAATTLGLLKPGQRVNIEVDILAKHVAKLLEK